jgi:hypothetical protein
MNKILKWLGLPIIVLVFIWHASAVGAKAGPRLYFEPSEGNYNVGDSFDVVVQIDTGDKEAMAADALISFDQNKLKVNRVSLGSFFSGFDYNIENANGKLTIYSFSEQALVTNSGVGEIATISFEATAEGTASVSFLCESGVDTDSAIWDQQGNDLIDCAACGSGSYTIGESAEPINTPAEATNTPQPINTTAPDQPTSTPSSLPETGIETPLLIAVLAGGIMLLFSWALSL